MGLGGSVSHASWVLLLCSFSFFLCPLSASTLINSHMIRAMQFIWRRHEIQPASRPLTRFLHVCIKMFAVCVPCLACKKMFFIVKSMKDCVAILSTAGAPLISVYVHVCVVCEFCLQTPARVQSARSLCKVYVCVKGRQKRLWVEVRGDLLPSLWRVILHFHIWMRMYS